MKSKIHELISFDNKVVSKTKNKLLILASMLIISANINAALAQVSIGQNSIGANDYVGSSNGFNVIFKANGTERMRIDQSNGMIGIGTTSPAYLLDVSGGDINVGASSTIANGYRLGTTKYFWNAGNTTNTLIGAGAGNSLTSAVYSNDCVIIGAQAVATATITALSGCVAIGKSALYNFDALTGGTIALGNSALYNTTSGNHNTVIGYYTGYSNTTGTNNILFGENTNYFNVTGSYNTISGYEAGKGVTGNSHSNNSFFGYKAGYGTTIGGNNVFMGYQSGYSNTSAGENVALGYEALKTQSYSNSSSAWSSYNVAVGNQALYSNQPTSTANGFKNTALGHQTLYSNTTGYANTANGFNAGYTNSTGAYNSANGYTALYTNSTGSYNTAQGNAALYSNTTGDYNTAIGSAALYSNSGAGVQNTAVGKDALYYNTTGDYNTASGTNAGATNTTGNNNTCIGYGADVNTNNLSNATALGNGAVANASNKVRIGDANVTVIEGTPAAYTSSSDGRFKNNIREEVKGLEFITKLRPVTYNFDTKKFNEFLIKNMPDSIKEIRTNGVDYTASTNILHTGFIAQEVEQAAQQIGYDFDGVHAPADDNDNYSLSYAQFVVPLVKAVQEQQTTIETLQSEIAILKGSNQRTNGSGNEEQGKAPSLHSIELANAGSVILYQNEPNPFEGATAIRYFVPDNITGSVLIVFSDMFGKEVNKLEIKEKGFGKIDANTENLAAGIYSYSLVVDGKIMDTKKMLRNQ